MHINRLKEFITLASCLNYSKAANQLYLTQPALSRHIHDLENTLGAQLFIRDTHNVHLTSIGELFYREAKTIVDQYEHALMVVKQAATNATGELSLGFLGVASQDFLAEFVTAFTTSHPEIQLHLTCGNMNELMIQLTQGKFDVAIVTHFSKEEHAGLESERISRHPLFAVMHPLHPLSGKESLALSELEGFPLINFNDHNQMAREYNRMLMKKAGIHATEIENVDTVEEGIFMASINRGYFIIPEYLLGLVPERLSTIPLDDEHCRITLNLIWEKNNTNQALPLFVKEFRVFMRNNYPK